MSRIASLIVVATATTLLTAPVSFAQKVGLRLGETFEGEIPATAERHKTQGKNAPRSVVHTDVPVTLKAGQSYAAQVTVSGSKRKVALALNDPAGKRIVRIDEFLDTSNELTFEASVSGTFKVAVISDQAGAFKLRVVAEGGAEDVEADARALEAKIRQLKQELSEAEAKLDALKKKSASKRQ
jgi:hypothetical protein